MNNVTYEKPSMKIVDLRSTQAIAAPEGPCLPQAAKGGNFYYDIPGNGWLVITTSSNCSGTVVGWYYEQNPELVGKVDPVPQAIIDEYYARALAILQAGGEKQQFSGANYGEPEPNWS